MNLLLITQHSRNNYKTKSKHLKSDWKLNFYKCCEGKFIESVEKEGWRRVRKSVFKFSTKVWNSFCLQLNRADSDTLEQSQINLHWHEHNAHSLINRLKSHRTNYLMTEQLHEKQSKKNVWNVFFKTFFPLFTEPSEWLSAFNCQKQTETNKKIKEKKSRAVNQLINSRFVSVLSVLCVEECHLFALREVTRFPQISLIKDVEWKWKTWNESWFKRFKSKLSPESVTKSVISDGKCSTWE